MHVLNKTGPGFPTSYVMIFMFSGFKMRGDCLFCWYMCIAWIVYHYCLSFFVWYICMFIRYLTFTRCSLFTVNILNYMAGLLHVNLVNLHLHGLIQNYRVMAIVPQKFVNRTSYDIMEDFFSDKVYDCYTNNSDICLRLQISNVVISQSACLP